MSKHIEVLVEDSSGEKLLASLLPKILGGQGKPYSWRVHSYRGIGRIPTGLKPQNDPRRRFLLDQLPKLLRGYGQVPDTILLILLDSDRRDCKQFLQELCDLASSCRAPQKTMFRLAIEEIEAWYLGDQAALFKAYPHARRSVLDTYLQDRVCDTWELLADAVYPGGSGAIKKAGWPLSGQLKHEWAEKIGPHLNVEENVSPSFMKFRDGLRRLVR